MSAERDLVPIDCSTLPDWVVAAAEAGKLRFERSVSLDRSGMRFAMEPGELEFVDMFVTAAPGAEYV